MMDTTDEPIAPIETLSSRLIDSEFREGYSWGYRVALADLLVRCEFLLPRTAALNDLRTTAQRLLTEVQEETASVTLPHQEFDS